MAATEERVLRQRAADAAVEAVNRVLPQWLVFVMLAMAACNIVYSFTSQASTKTYNNETRRIVRVTEITVAKNSTAISAITRIEALTEQLEDATAVAGELTQLIKAERERLAVIDNERIRENE